MRDWLKAFQAKLAALFAEAAADVPQPDPARSLFVEEPCYSRGAGPELLAAARAALVARGRP